MTDPVHVVRPIGWVESPLTDRHTAPLQGDEGSPEAWLVFKDEVSDGLRNLEALNGTAILDVKPVLDPGIER